ncbi:hypothetical protein BpHYR1_012513 [Brachionus plicatilis]|uniref:Uncharacterized protein n=1 Tax=Brachionus plicatilis TaxID=10195 RepID=A0A3M7Q3G3_BRAPC|nr:hypothetical protein BpHYR1_012513 [Brachionus plicatilis]
MFDVFHALGTLPSRRDKLKSSMISNNEFLANWIIKIRLVIISKVYLSVEAFNSDLLTASFLEVSSYFPTFFDQINNYSYQLFKKGSLKSLTNFFFSNYFNWLNYSVILVEKKSRIC